MDIGHLLDDYGKVVLTAMRKMKGSDVDVRLFNDTEADRSLARARNFQVVKMTDVKKFSDNPDGTSLLEGSGDAKIASMVYMWRDARWEKEEADAQEKINKAREGAAQTALQNEGDRLGVKVDLNLTKGEI